VNWYIAVLKKYAVFSGRASRTEFWMFTLVNIVIELVLSFIDSRTGMVYATTSLGLLSGLYGLAVFLPGIAVTARRLHDTSRSGWWMLICFIPILGGLVLLVFLVLDSTPDTNAWGPSPKGVAAA
jgi:uncharacterized membrane protein YhaH (DUF805 family)